MSDTSLTRFQIEVAQLFFTLPESQGFLLAGGAALAAHQLTQRPTQDLDLFAGPQTTVTEVVESLSQAVTRQKWTCEVLRAGDTFTRMRVSKGNDNVYLDFAIDSPPIRPPVVSFLGPVFDPLELAARKLLALFDRAAARDFVDVFLLAQHFDRDIMLGLACDLDPGFNKGVFAEMLGSMKRYADHDLPIDADLLDEMKMFYTSWIAELKA
jgi:hypothetical protein